MVGRTPKVASLRPTALSHLRIISVGMADHDHDHDIFSELVFSVLSGVLSLVFPMHSPPRFGNILDFSLRLQLTVVVGLSP